MTRVSKAVIPMAGTGARFLPATKTVPKVLLPILNKPLAQLAVEEAATAGITEIGLVVAPGMGQLRDHFKVDGRDPELDALCRSVKLTFIVQEQARGLGDAVTQSREWVGDATFTVLLPDMLLFGGRSALRQTLDRHAECDAQCLAVYRVTPDEASSKGIVDADLGAAAGGRIRMVVEKPPPQDAPSDLAIFGRYVLDSSLFDFLSATGKGASGEVHLTDAIQRAIRTDGRPSQFVATVLKGAVFDAGEPRGMAAAASYLLG